MGRQAGGWNIAGSIVWAAVVAGALIASGSQAGGQEDGAGAELSAWEGRRFRATRSSFRAIMPRIPDHRIEWWYYTGNLRASDGSRRFGYQLTFFRVGVDRQPLNPSRWAVRDLYMAHFAVTDVERGAHHVAERLNRAGIGWAGASTETLHVWNDGWAVTVDEGEQRISQARGGE